MSALQQQLQELAGLALDSGLTEAADWLGRVATGVALSAMDVAPVALSPLKLERPLICFDIEGTGVDPVNDRIIQLAAMKILPDLTIERRNKRLNPGIPIPEAATVIHGITDADVAGEPQFKAAARSVHEFFSGCDLCGFNAVGYDVLILWQELFRAGIEWDVSGVRIVDVGIIFKNREPRTLAAALHFYCGRDHDGAHDAMADVEATLDSLMGQLARYPDLGSTIEELAKASMMDERPRADLAGHFLVDESGDLVFTMRRARGVKVRDDLGLADWILRNDFPEQTKRVLRAEMNRVMEEEYQEREVHGS